MYIPAPFASDDEEDSYGLIERNSFALLVTHRGGQPFASHVPFLLDRAAGPRGTLLGHLARANPQWQDPAGQPAPQLPALAIFSGPHAYISPAWYEDQNVVPTWNYSAVHVYGAVEWIEDPAELLDLVERFVRQYEQPRPAPWTFDRGSEFNRRLVAGIIGFRLPIERLEGKFKMSQNQPAERRRRVIAALRSQGDEQSRAVADEIERRME